MDNVQVHNQLKQAVEALETIARELGRIADSLEWTANAAKYDNGS
jgi:uncharacterized protein YukE